MGERTAVHLALRWGDAVVRTACLSPARAFTLGEGGDWDVPPEALGARRATLLVRDRRGVFLSIPPAASAWIADAGGSPFRPAPSHALTLGARARIELGALGIDVEVIAAPAVLRRRLHLALGAFGHQALSFAFHVGLLAMLALFVPRLSTDVDDAEDQAERVAILRNALGGSVPREREGVTVGLDEYEPVEDGDGPPGDVAPGANVMGAGDAPRGPRRRAAATYEVARPGVIAPPRAVIGSLSPAGPDAREQAAALAAMFALEPVTSGAWGSLPGGTAEGGTSDAFAAGDLALSGVGAGSGDPLEVIGLSGFGTSHDAAFGFGSSRGLGGMSGRGASHVRGPRVCGCDGVLVNGRLPPETIQRVVRESFGRFRACYEPALVQNPSLQGRVSTRFLVARDGLVSFSTDAGSDLPDAHVVSCVVQAFTRVAFPPPAGGTVEVTYPIVFSPE